MRILIAEDDFASRKFMLSFLSDYGECDAFALALEEKAGYDLVCLDIMMPKMDGYQALEAIREIEKEQKVPEERASKVIMTTALSDSRNVRKAFELGCVAYAGKPISQEKFERQLQKLGLLSNKK